MSNRAVVHGDWEFPPFHGLGIGIMRFHVQAEMHALGIVACVMTEQEIPDNSSPAPAWLYWNDGVANAWCEEFPSLAAAVGRLAALIAFGEDGWIDGFKLDAQQFSEFWQSTVMGGV